MTIGKRDIGRLVALLAGELEEREADRLRRRLEHEPELARAYERMKRIRARLGEVADEPPPSVSFRQLEAQVRWKLAKQQEQTSHRPSRRRRALVWGAVLAATGAASAFAAVAVDRALRAGDPSAGPTTPASRTTSAERAKQQPTKPSRPAAQLAALATVASGDVRVAVQDGGLTPLSLDRPVLPGERVVTGSNGQVTLQWASGSGLRLASDGEVELKQLTAEMQRVALWEGRVRVAIRHDDRSANGASHDEQRPRFELEAGNVRVLVTGTRFSVALTRDATEVEVEQGTVRVAPIDDDSGRRTIAVRAGHRLRIPRSGGKPVREPVRASSEHEARLYLQNWPGLAWVLARSGGLIVESQPPGADLKFDQLLVGHTNLRLRGSAGRHLVELWRDDKLLRRQWVEVKAASLGRLALDVRLHKQRAKAHVERLPITIHRLFRQRAPLIRACYERYLKRKPTLAGRFVMRITIGDDGSVAKARIDRDTLSEPAVGQCALRAVKRWRFPPGNGADVVYPFIFRPH